MSRSHLRWIHRYALDSLTSWNDRTQKGTLRRRQLQNMLLRLHESWMEVYLRHWLATSRSQTKHTRTLAAAQSTVRKLRLLLSVRLWRAHAQRVSSSYLRAARAIELHRLRNLRARLACWCVTLFELRTAARHVVTATVACHQRLQHLSWLSWRRAYADVTRAVSSSMLAISRRPTSRLRSGLLHWRAKRAVTSDCIAPRAISIAEVHDFLDGIGDIPQSRRHDALVSFKADRPFLTDDAMITYDRTLARLPASTAPTLCSPEKSIRFGLLFEAMPAPALDIIDEEVAALLDTLSCTVEATPSSRVEVFTIQVFSPRADFASVLERFNGSTDAERRIAGKQARFILSAAVPFAPSPLFSCLDRQQLARFVACHRHEGSSVPTIVAKLSRLHESFETATGEALRCIALVEGDPSKLSLLDEEPLAPPSQRNGPTPLPPAAPSPSPLELSLPMTFTLEGDLTSFDIAGSIAEMASIFDVGSHSISISAIAPGSVVLTVVVSASRQALVIGLTRCGRGRFLGTLEIMAFSHDPLPPPPASNPGSNDLVPTVISTVRPPPAASSPAGADRDGRAPLATDSSSDDDDDLFDVDFPDDPASNAKASGCPADAQAKRDDEVNRMFERLTRPTFAKPWLPYRPLIFWSEACKTDMLLTGSIPNDAPICPPKVKDNIGAYIVVYSPELMEKALACADESDILESYFSSTFQVLGEADTSSDIDLHLAIRDVGAAGALPVTRPLSVSQVLERPSKTRLRQRILDAATSADVVAMCVPADSARGAPKRENFFRSTLEEWLNTRPAPNPSAASFEAADWLMAEHKDMYSRDGMLEAEQARLQLLTQDPPLLPPTVPTGESSLGAASLPAVFTADSRSQAVPCLNKACSATVFKHEKICCAKGCGFPGPDFARCIRCDKAFDPNTQDWCRHCNALLPHTEQ